MIRLSTILEGDDEMHVIPGWFCTVSVSSNLSLVGQAVKMQPHIWGGAICGR